MRKVVQSIDIKPSIFLQFVLNDCFAYRAKCWNAGVKEWDKYFNKKKHSPKLNILIRRLYRSRGFNDKVFTHDLLTSALFDLYREYGIYIFNINNSRGIYPKPKELTVKDANYYNVSFADVRQYKNRIYIASPDYEKHDWFFDSRVKLVKGELVRVRLHYIPNEGYKAYLTFEVEV